MTGAVYRFPNPEESAVEHLANAEAAEGLAAMMRDAGVATLGELFSATPTERGNVARLTDDHEQVAADIIEKRGIGYALSIAEAICDALRSEGVGS